MEACRNDRGGRHVARFAVVLALAVAAPARGQAPAPGDPAASTGAERPLPPRVEMSLIGTIVESLTGDVYAEGSWRPLPLSTFFSEGWLEPWASGPAGREGLTPRHGWLGAFDGVFYRLWFTTFTYQNQLNTSSGGNRYAGQYRIFLPLSRRFEVSLTTPFVVSNRTAAANRGYTSEFGDLTVTPRFLLSESEALTQVFAVDVRTPTGTKATANGIMAVQPRYEFWSNPIGPWVFRGGSGIVVPMNTQRTPTFTAYSGDVALGRYFTPHDGLFGDLIIYAAANCLVPLDHTSSNPTFASVGPGTRFHLGNNFFFLHFWEFPVVAPRPFPYAMQVALMKVF